MRYFVYFAFIFYSFQSWACDSKIIDQYQSPFGQFEIVNYSDYSLLKIRNRKYFFSKDKKCTFENAKVINMPIKSFALSSATYVYMFTTHNKLNLIKYFLGKNFLWTDQIDLSHLKDFSTEFPYEDFLRDQIGLFIVYSDILNDMKIKKLQNLKIPYIVIDDYLSDEPLQRAEWNIVFGFLIGNYKESLDLYKEITNSYKKIKVSNNKKVNVLIGNFQGAIWNSPGKLSYFGNLVRDAGGELIGTKDQRETVYLSRESFVGLNLKPDVWLTHNFWRSEDEIKRDKNYKVISAERIFNNTAKMSAKNHSNDFWQAGIARPDLMLKEYVEMIGNKEYLGNYWYKRIK